MANVTAAEFKELENIVKTLEANLNQMFLLVFGIIIFCEYFFPSI